MLHDDQVAATVAAAQAGTLQDIVYSYASEDEALEFCRVVGWPAANAKRLAPMLAASREGHPRDYWGKIWLSFVGAHDASGGADPGAQSARSARDLFVSHMQAVAQYGVKLRASGRRVLVVQVCLPSHHHGSSSARLLSIAPCIQACKLPRRLPYGAQPEVFNRGRRSSL
jgi:hypothetical protein